MISGVFECISNVLGGREVVQRYISSTLKDAKLGMDVNSHQEVQSTQNKALL